MQSFLGKKEEERVVWVFAPDICECFTQEAVNLFCRFFNESTKTAEWTASIMDPWDLYSPTVVGGRGIPVFWCLRKTEQFVDSTVFILQSDHLLSNVCLLLIKNRVPSAMDRLCFGVQPQEVERIRLSKRYFNTSCVHHWVTHTQLRSLKVSVKNLLEVYLFPTYMLHFD